MAEQYRWYVGVDWATELHQVCVLDRERQIVEQKKVDHSGSGLAQMVERLMQISGNRASASPPRRHWHTN